MANKYTFYKEKFMADLKELTEFNLSDCQLSKFGKMMKQVCFTEEL